MKKTQEHKNGSLSFSSKTLWISLICVVLALSLAVACVIVFLPEKGENRGESDSIYYYPVKYDEDIFENQAYLEFERDLFYSASDITKEYRFIEDRDSASVECRFFIDYFDAVIRGDYEAYNGFFVDDYFETAPEFTMQMIYEPYVMLHSVTEEEIEGEIKSIYNFEVRYRIFKNNGTFRQGVASNQAVPQIYRLIKSEDSYKILSILDVEYED